MELLETWKYRGIRLRSGKRSKIRERSRNVYSQRNLIAAPQQNNLPVLYSYCNLYFVCDVHRELGLVNVHLFVILLAILNER